MIASLDGQVGAEITVIVVNWNRRDLLRRCLESLARQQGAGFEVIVVDNGSEDGSPEMVEREFAASGRLRVSLIRNQV
ncbi:MAG: glycosyltransferase, partial [Acidobacteriales bacterium]